MIPQFSFYARDVISLAINIFRDAVCVLRFAFRDATNRGMRAQFVKGRRNSGGAAAACRSFSFPKFVKRAFVLAVPISIEFNIRRGKKTSRQTLRRPICNYAFARRGVEQNCDTRTRTYTCARVHTRFPTIAHVRIVSKVRWLICRRRKRNYNVSRRLRAANLLTDF